MTIQDLQGANSMLSVGPVVTTSVGMCDIDIRPVSNLILQAFYITVTNMVLHIAYIKKNPVIIAYVLCNFSSPTMLCNTKAHVKQYTVFPFNS